MHPINTSKIKRILITRIDRIGDVVLSTPVFPAIKKKYPHAYLAVMVTKETEPIVQGNSSIDDVIVYDRWGKYRSWLKTILFGLSLRPKHFDVVVHLHPTNRVNIISWLAGIPIRIGYKRKNAHLLTHTIPEMKEFGRRHEADYNFDLMVLIGVARPNRFHLYFPLPESERESLEHILPKNFNDRYVVFHPSASCPSKRWAPERLAEVADCLVRDYGISPVIIGEGEGVSHALLMQESMKEKALNLAGKLNLGMLGWILKGARLLISNDSGPVHIACAVGTPVISIFGRNRIGLGVSRWRPLSDNSSYIQKDVGCIECLAHRCQIDFKCLKELKTEEVLEEAKRYEAFLV